MIRPFTCLCMVLAASAGLYLYQAKHRTRMLDREIGRVVQEAEATRARTGLLKAEWELLNQPDRLADLANRFLTLKPLSPGQFVTLAELDRRLPPIQQPAAPAPAAVVAVTEPAAPPAPAQPAPSAPVTSPLQLAAARSAPPHLAPPHREIAPEPLALAAGHAEQPAASHPISASALAGPRPIETRYQRGFDGRAFDGQGFGGRPESGPTYAALGPRAYPRLPLASAPLASAPVASALGAPTPVLAAPVPVLSPYASPPGGQ